MRARLVGFVAVLAVGLVASQSASAVVIGDKDWRQLTETTGFSWLNVNTACGTGLCSGSISSVSLDGWYWADATDVAALFDALIKPDSTQFPTSTTSYFAAGDADIANAVRTVFNPTRVTNFGTAQYYEVSGLTRSSNGSTTSMAYLLDSPFATSLDYAAFDTSYPKNLGTGFTGIWLYRPVSVPEPGTLALFALGAAAIWLLRRQRTVTTLA
ncbi:MAG: PEP-CTERM sorting domain-containing protein [Steroidobacteraceae bacterium]|nr:PEP-CTERM sorting domain-containing protein [Steroidobacteraceae bacterium]